jgi:hypothetical protein
MAAWILLTDTTSSIHARKVLLHAVNLRYGTDGFISPPKEVVLRIFITLKNPSTSVGIEPANYYYCYYKNILAGITGLILSFLCTEYFSLSVCVMWLVEDSPLKPLLSKVHTKEQFVLKWYPSVAVFVFLWALLCKRKGNGVTMMDILPRCFSLS